MSVEAASMPEMPQVLSGLDAIRRKGEWWTSHNEVHDAKVKGPFPNGGVYTVENGKIVREEFFYPTGA